MNRSRTPHPELTDYVRARLNSRVGRGAAEVGDRRIAGLADHRIPGLADHRIPELVEGALEAESGLRTVVRPRPLLAAEADPVVPPDSFAPTDPVTSAADVMARPDRDPVRAEEHRRTWPVRFTRQHLMVVAIVLAIGALIAGYALTRARAVPVADPVVVESTGQPAPSETATPAATAPPVRVHVVGEVEQPGVHTLPDGSRVIEAIEAAGGLTPAAKPGALNLAQVLVDGQQVVVGDTERPSEVRGADGGGGGGGGGKVNLNTATETQLETLPGVGPVTAGKIVTWRTDHGRFTRIEELQEVPGIGPKSFAELAPHVTV